MSALIRFMLPFIGYLSVATVITAAMLFGYLRRSGKLDDEKLFRLVALVQDIDLEEIENAGKEGAAEVPAEEPSFEERQRQFQTASLHFDAKQKQLAVSLVNFDYQLKQLNAATEQYARLRNEVEQFLVKQGELIISEKVKEVREQLAALPPKQAKPILIMFIRDNHVDDVIMLLSSMKAKDRQDILKIFTTEEDLDMLYRIQRKMLAGDPAKPFIDEKLKALEQLKAQDK